MFKTIFLSVILLSVLSCCISTAVAQPPTWTIDLIDKEKKPEKFENRKLGSEKMADKKFTFVRHFFQNTFTHYNYYYNANNKINSVIERAKAVQKDDYTKLLPYYPYTLENTASQKSELDSVLLKATAGILLHDLRNDWVDILILLPQLFSLYSSIFSPEIKMKMTAGLLALLMLPPTALSALPIKKNEMYYKKRSPCHPVEMMH